MTKEAKRHYRHWQRRDRRMLARLDALIEACKVDPVSGIGHPEPLRHHGSGAWSRRITGTHRLIYSISAESVSIIACHGHYGKVL